MHSAYAVLTDRGYDRTSIADIARHAQIGHGTVYRYFADKRELLDHVFDHAVAKLITAVNVGSLTSAQLAGFEQSLALIEVFGWRLFSLIDADPGMLTLITVQSSAIDPELRYRVVGMISALDAAMSVAFDTASPDWAAATDPMVRATFGRMMLAMSGPGVMSSLSPATQDRAHRQRCLDTVTAIADRGLLTAASPETADAEGSTAATASTTSAPAAGWGATGSSPAGTAEAPSTVAEEPGSASAAAVVQRRRSQLYAAAWELFVQRGYRDVDVAVPPLRNNAHAAS